MLDIALKQHREKLIRDHFEGEVKQDFDEVLSTFPHPRYELIALNRIHDGREDVMKYYLNTRQAFPDQHHEMISLRHSDDAVICEFYLKGTHLGNFGVIPPTGNSFKVRMTAFFIFEGAELVCERIYFDVLSVVRQLFAGINFKSPQGILKLLKIAASMVRELK